MPSLAPSTAALNPPDATDEVVLRVQAKTTHPTFRQSEVTAFP